MLSVGPGLQNGALHIRVVTNSIQAIGLSYFFILIAINLILSQKILTLNQGIKISGIKARYFYRLPLLDAFRTLELINIRKELNANMIINF